MSAPFRRHYATARSGNAGASGMRMALDCARSIYEAVDRRMPEAAALANWLQQSAAAFGLPDTAVPDDDTPRRSRRRGVPMPDWRKIGSALTSAEAAIPDNANAPADRWIEAIAGTLALDPLEARMLALALHYELDQRVERLFDAVSECRGLITRFHRDSGLIALLLHVPTADIEMRLTGDAKLRASGLLRLDQHGELHVLERLVSLIRQDVSPSANFYDQLLGAIAVDPLPWESFEHLGRQAEVVASVLRAALSGRESGINILLYGPPGTGKTSFAATLAARTGARLRPVAEADEEGGEPARHERLAGLRLAQRLAVPGNTLLLFDEAEDLFVRRSGGGFDEPVASSRVFMHRLLERMAVPVIWTANDIGVLGPAVLRRMTMCLELKVPNLVTRTRLWRRMGETEGVVLPEADAARLARLVPAAPAVASAALRATRLAGGGAETARLIVEGVARAVHGRAGIAVHAFNQRNIGGILAMIRTVGALVGALDKAETLARSHEARLAEVAALVRGRPKPKVYFEEWDDPLISGIGWVSELIEIAGGEEVFPELRQQKAARDRIVSPEDVIGMAPDIILASWCGKKVVPDKIRQRPGWDVIPAVRNGRIVEIKSALILQPGPAALTDGLDSILAALGQQ